MKTRWVLLLGVLVGTLTMGGLGVEKAAFAQSDVPPPRSRHKEDKAIPPRRDDRRDSRIYGVIEAVEGSSLELTTPIGPVTAVTDVNSRFHVPSVTEAGLNDLAVGDVVGAAGWWDDQENGLFHAQGVARLEADHVLPLAGELSDVRPAALTVETERGPAAVLLTDESVYHIRGTGEAGQDDLAAGMRVIIRGRLDVDGALMAHTITAFEAKPRPARLRGRVEALAENGLTIRAAGGRQLQILTDETTEFRVPGIAAPSLANLQVNDQVVCEGVMVEAGTGRASLVMVLPDQAARLEGKVTTVDEARLTLDTPGGQVEVLITADTIFRIPGVQEATGADIEIGDHVTAVGVWEDEATFQASGIGARGGRREGQPGTVRGRVIRVEAERIILGTLHGPVTVSVDDDTRYRIPGGASFTLDDVMAGRRFSVRGEWTADGTLQAHLVLGAPNDK